MRKLLWKDYRLFRPLLLLSASIVVLVYGVGIAAEMASSWPTFPSADNWAGMLVSYGTVLLFLSFFKTGMLGGYAIAVERSERSAHFLASLPPTKVLILASKLIVVAVATGVLWGWMFLSIHILASKLSTQPFNGTHTLTMSGAAATCVLTFGVGWCASACMEKPIIPIILALCSPLAVSIALMLAAAMLGISNVRISDWSNVVCVVLGLVAWITGSWSYHRRVEP